MSDMQAPKSETRADIKRWNERIKSAIRFDEEARRQYALDRRNARGDSAGKVSANLLGTYIDITASFLVAKSPDVSVQPAKSVEPPTLEAVRDIAEDIVRQKPEIVEASNATLMAATAMQAPDAPMIAQQTIDMKVEQEIQTEYETLRKKYARRQRDSKVLAESIELVVGLLWDAANVKKRINLSTRSALTISVGWVKASWQTMTGADDPMTAQRLHTLEDNLAKVQQLKAELEAGSGKWGWTGRAPQYSYEGSDEQAKIAELELQIAAVREASEQVTSQGFVADNVAGEDMIIAKGYAIHDYLNAPWIAHRMAIPLEDAKAQLPELEGCWDEATKYYPRLPTMMQNENVMPSSVDAKNADTFVTNDQARSDTGTGDSKSNECWVMRYEIWDKTSNHMMTMIDGISTKWAKAPVQPVLTTRFYPFFLTIIGIIDNERHAQSLVARTTKLMDEYNRIKSAETEHRRRIRPKMIFNAGLFEPDQVEKIMRADTAEYIAVTPLDINVDLRTVFVPVQYPSMDASLYDTSLIIRELEREWGVQEALGGAVSVAKTATEADIQQQGFSSRTDDKRAAIEDTLTELAQYTAELALTNLSAEEVQEMIGSDCLWPEITSPEQLKSLCRVGIKAGSTGKPNTALERQSWSILLPQLSQAITAVGQLRGSTPSDIADKLEELARVTADRNGESIDIDAMMPQTPSQAMMLPAPMGMPPMPPEGMPPDTGIPDPVPPQP